MSIVCQPVASNAQLVKLHKIIQKNTHLYHLGRHINSQIVMAPEIPNLLNQCWFLKIVRITVIKFLLCTHPEWQIFSSLSLRCYLVSLQTSNKLKNSSEIFTDIFTVMRNILELNTPPLELYKSWHTFTVTSFLKIET